MKPTVKVCGQTDPEIIKLCIEQGASLIGFIVNYPKSPRSISIEKLKSLSSNIPNNVKKSSCDGKSINRRGKRDFKLL